MPKSRKNTTTHRKAPTVVAPEQPRSRDLVAEESHAAQLGRAELLYARHFSKEEILRALMTEFAVTEEAADGVIREVRAHWRTEALNHGDMHDQRERSRRGFAYIQNLALDFRKPLVGRDGEPMTWVDPKTGERKPVLAPEPDLQVALRAQVELAKLHGLYTADRKSEGKSLGDLVAQMSVALAVKRSGGVQAPNLDPRIVATLEPESIPQDEDEGDGGE
jgi:hypothetical protein